ncbi:hypothetical protein GCM10009528_10510 [Kineococcus aurantiacus]
MHRGARGAHRAHPDRAEPAEREQHLHALRRLVVLELHLDDPAPHRLAHHVGTLARCEGAGVQHATRVPPVAACAVVAGAGPVPVIGRVHRRSFRAAAERLGGAASGAGAAPGLWCGTA